MKLNSFIMPKIYPKVLFYTSIPRAFRTTLIGHLYEICQVYPTILLSEELDAETERILQKKELFPKLEKIIPVRQFTGERKNLFSENKHLYLVAKNVIQDYKPNILILPSDTYLFELYLIRFIKKIGGISVSLSPSLHSLNFKKVAWRVDRINAILKLPKFLPFIFRLIIIKARKYAGYILYNCLLPLMVGEMPFWGKASRVLYSPGGLNADYYIAYSSQEHDLCIKEGVSSEKIYILSHPLVRQGTREFFKKAYFNKAFKYPKNDEKIILLLYPAGKIKFRRNDNSIISEQDIKKAVIEIVTLINKILPKWKIFIKPHPIVQNVLELKNSFKEISSCVDIKNPQDPVDMYIEVADLIISVIEPSTVLFMAVLQCPDKPIISLDFHHELSGDYYKDFEGIEYIDSEKSFIDILKLIRDNKYKKKQGGLKKEELRGKEFSDTVELLEYLFQKNVQKERNY